MPNMGKHTDFTGMVLVDIEEFPEVNIPVIVAHAQLCEMCDPGDWENPKNQTADYTVAATAVLGPGGYDQHFCQKHMIEYVRTSPDTWMSRA